MSTTLNISGVSVTLWITFFLFLITNQFEREDPLEKNVVHGVLETPLDIYKVYLSIYFEIVRPEAEMTLGFQIRVGKQ